MTHSVPHALGAEPVNLARSASALHGPPRLVIGGVSSSVGKTTMTLGLARAFRERGLNVAVFKCGPDYLDPSYLELASGRPAHNLDGWMMGEHAVVATFLEASAGADIALIEGVMGLFDGASPTDEAGSTAQIAKWLHAPVLLAVDVSGMARTIAALVKGFAEFDSELQVAGVAVNRAGSARHVQLVASALQASGGPPLLGGLTKQPDLVLPSRHLGLRTAEASPQTEQLLSAWAQQVSQGFDLDAVQRLAAEAKPLVLPEPAPGVQVAAPVGEGSRPASPQGVRIAIAQDEAFHFYYPDNLRRLREHGATLVPFSPLADESLPEGVHGVYIGGGYPEVYAEALSANSSLREHLLQFAHRGGCIYAECGGLMYLAESLQTLGGQCFPMVGVFAAQASMCSKLQALGYVEVRLRGPSALGPAEQLFRGHQFRYSELQWRVVPGGASPQSASPAGSKPGETTCVYEVQKRRGGPAFAEGYQVGNAVGSYVHAHWASNPEIPANWLRHCAQTKGRLDGAVSKG